MSVFSPSLDDSTYRIGERIKIGRLVYKFTGTERQDMRSFSIILG